jgi:hypothetical protein
LKDAIENFTMLVTTLTKKGKDNDQDRRIHSILCQRKETQQVGTNPDSLEMLYEVVSTRKIENIAKKLEILSNLGGRPV